MVAQSVPQGQPVDASGGPAIDPTRNVLGLVEAAIRRQDDLRNAESSHLHEVAELRAQYAQELRKAESDRIDAIRAVDVGAVNRAAEVSAQQANTLAVQVTQSAEALRTQVAAAATASNIALAAALDPIQKAIDDLRRAQYEAQGGKANVVEARDVRSEKRLDMGQVLVFTGLLITAASFGLAFVGLLIAAASFFLTR